MLIIYTFLMNMKLTAPPYQPGAIQKLSVPSFYYLWSKEERISHLSLRHAVSSKCGLTRHTTFIFAIFQSI